MSRRPAAALLLLVVFAGMSLAPAPRARGAQLMVFDAVEGSFGAGPAVYKTQSLAQAFNASANYRLIRIQTMMYDQDPSNSINLTIQESAGGLPDGNVLARAVGDGPAGYDWVTFDLDVPVDVVAGRMYWIVIEDDKGMNNPNGYRWADQTPDPYPNGYFAMRSGGGGWVPDYSGDLLFRAWGWWGPSIVSALTVDAATAGVLDPLAYVAYFNNSGTTIAAHVWANLTLSANTTYESDTAASEGGIAVGPLSWDFANVAVGPHSFLVTARVSAEIFDGLPLVATLRIDYTNETEARQESTEASATTIARVPSITVAKSVTPRFLGPGENLTYAITLVNAGSRSSPWVWANDTLPPEVIYQGNTANALGNYSGEWWDGTVLHVNFTDLPRGTFSFDVRAQARTGLLNGTAFTNTIVVDFTDNRGITIPLHPRASATARIQGASIQVAVAPNIDRAGPGQEVRYRVRYDNRGNAVARYVWINETLPPEVDYLSDTGGGALAGSSLRFAYTNVSVGLHSLTVTVRIRNGTADGTWVRSRVDLAHTDSDGSPAPPSNATAAVLVVEPSVALGVLSPAAVDSGAPFDLVVTVTNGGNASASALWINVTTPSSFSRGPDNASDAGGAPTANGWYFPGIEPGSLQFQVRFVVATGVADGTPAALNVTGTYLDELGRLGEASRVGRDLTIVAPVFRLSAANSRDPLPVGETGALSISYANIGGGSASDVWINLTIPEGVEITNASEPWVATTGMTFTWHLRNVGPGTRDLFVTIRPQTERIPGPAVVDVRLAYADAGGHPLGATTTSLAFGISSASWSAQAWGLVALIAIVTFLAAFIGYRMYGVGSRDKGEILQLFVLHKSGLLLKHYTKQLHGALDTDILAAMIVAVQNFVRESFSFKAGDLEEMKFGTHKILLAHGENLILAAVVRGRYLDRVRSALQLGVGSLEAEFGGTLRGWSGVVDELVGMDTTLDQILQGKAPAANGKNGSNGKDGRNGKNGRNGSVGGPVGPS